MKIKSNDGNDYIVFSELPAFNIICYSNDN